MITNKRLLGKKYPFYTYCHRLVIRNISIFSALLPSFDSGQGQTATERIIFVLKNHTSWSCKLKKIVLNNTRQCLRNTDLESSLLTV